LTLAHRHREIKYPASWADAQTAQSRLRPQTTVLTDYIQPILAQEGDKLPVSKMSPDGTVPTGTTQYEKRGIAVDVPKWIPENCIQCNQCALACPHAVIRPFLVTAEEKAAAPAGFETKKASGKEFDGLEFRIQISPFDCTGCGNCIDVCPAKVKAHEFRPWPTPSRRKKKLEQRRQMPGRNCGQPCTSRQPDAQTAVCSARQRGLRRNALCQTGNQLIATDGRCQRNGLLLSTAQRSNCPKRPTTRSGPAWGNSLFEDNAEFGFA
jgi:pyruvate-ferredoxin/flavodoxin oxidoreductase